MRGLLLASHPSLLAFTPQMSASIEEHFTSKKRSLAVRFSHFFGGLLQLFIWRNKARPMGGSMAALPFELLVQIVHAAARTQFNVTRDQIEGLLRLLSAHHAAIKSRMQEVAKRKHARLTLIEREEAQVVNGKAVVCVRFDIWPAL